MKTVKNLLMIVLVFAISFPCLGESIHLKRKRGQSNWTRSLELVTTIQADYNAESESLTIDFHENFGNVLISVSDSRGNVVYRDVVAASSGTSHFVSLRSLPAGEYDLLITPMGENALEGSFYVY